MTRLSNPTTHRARRIDALAREEWIADLNALIDDIARWSAERGWSIKRESKRIREDEIGTYSAPALIIQTAQGRLYFTPIARYVMGASGRIEISSSSFHQVVFIRNGRGWRFFTDDLVDLKKGWSKKSFDEVVQGLLNRV